VPNSQVELQDALRPLIVLMKRLDKISCKNNEVFVKAYFKVHVTAIPFLTSLFARGLPKELDDTNDLL